MKNESLKKYLARVQLKSYISTVFILSFLLVFSWFQADIFCQHIKQRYAYEHQKNNSQELQKSFSLDDVSYISDISISWTPDTPVLDTLIHQIDAANTRVYIEVYMLTQGRIKDALVRAHKRGVDVRAILEKNPYKAYNINNKHFDFLVKQGVNVVWSDPQNFSLNHAKFFLIDDQAILSTGNLTHSTFTKNTDLFVITSQPSIVSYLESIFLADFDGREIYPYHPSVILAPIDARLKIEQLLSRAQDSLDIYIPYIHDTSLQDILVDQAQSGKKVRIIVSQRTYENQYDDIKWLQSQGIEITSKKHMHSKAILIDNTYLTIGSINFSSYSLDQNREVMLVFQNDDQVENFQQVFERDFSSYDKKK